MIVLGVMSGSSMDGIDLALVEFNERDEVLEWNFISHSTRPLSSTLISRLSNVTDQKPSELVKTMDAYSGSVTTAIKDFLADTDQYPELIGVHGHTVIHLPESNFSWQLLNGAFLSEHLGCPVVCDFRNNDIALGGQGTPMAVFSDAELFKGHDYYLNLGGIANISIHKNGQWKAFDLCGCNQLLNFLSLQGGKAFDEGGKSAASGQVNSALLKALLSDAYLKKDPPKSLDNGEVKSFINDQLIAKTISINDKLRTVVALITTVIDDNIEVDSEKSSLFISGGGGHNTFLINELKKICSKKNISLHIPEAKIIDFKEAILTSLVAYRRYHKKPNFISQATGALRNTIGGAVYVPSQEHNRL